MSERAAEDGWIADKERSRRIGRAIQAKPGRCYANARVGLDWGRRHGILSPEARYIEGRVAIGDGKLMRHAWIVDRGVVVDPTPSEGWPSGELFWGGFNRYTYSRWKVFPKEVR
jgi:hypothetical protein